VAACQSSCRVNRELRRLFPHSTSHEWSYAQDTRNGDNPLSCHYGSLTLMGRKGMLTVCLWYCLILLYCTVHDLCVSADASRVGSCSGTALTVTELEDSVLILRIDGAVEDMFLSALVVKGVSSRARWSPRELVVDREFLSAGHGYFRQHFWLMKASRVGEQEVLWPYCWRFCFHSTCRHSCPHHPVQ
jgi:hypothetical protein